ncbi:MAG: hypothetical protein ACRED4_01095 [Brevundimonas sp.]
MNQRNRKRSLADVVGVEAWHDGFSAKSGKAKLHIDVVFGMARMGSAPSDRVQFRLALKQAEVVIVIPPGEPVGVDPASVVRDAPEVTGVLTRRSETENDTALEAGLRLGIAPTTPGGKAKLGASARRKTSQRQVLESAAKRVGLEVKHMRNGEGEHRWIIGAGLSSVLDGRPWPSDKPRLKLVDRRAEASRALEPTVRVEVRCRREDLEITDIRFKDDARQQAFLLREGHRNRIAAAEALIRSRLLQEGLIDPRADLSDDFLELTLSDTIVEG